MRGAKCSRHIDVFYDVTLLWTPPPPPFFFSSFS